MNPKENSTAESNIASTVAIKVRFMGDLRSVVGQPHTTVRLQRESTVGDLLASLCHQHGEPFRCRVISGPGKLHHTILILLNGENIKEVGELTARLEGDSEVEIIMLPMFEGG